MTTINPSLRWLIMILMSLLLFLGNFDFTAVVLALPKITTSFNTSLTEAHWIITAYIISSAAFISINMQVCRRMGEKNTFLLGCLIFTISSLICGLASNVFIIIVMRFIQGIGYAFSFPLIYSFIFNLFPHEKRGFAISILHCTSALAQAFGPTLGGILIYLTNWRFVFFINIPICLSICWMAWKFLPNEKKIIKVNSSEIVSAFYILFCLLLLMLTLNQNILNDPESFIRSIIFGIASILFLSLFIRKEKTSQNPLIDKALVKNKDFIIINIARAIIQIIFIEFLFLPSLFLQNTLGFNSAHTGAIYLSMTLTFAMLSVISGKLIDTIGPKFPLIAGLISLLFASFLLLYINFSNSTLLTLFSFVVAGLGIGLTFPSSLYICMNSISLEENKKVGSSIFLMNALIGSSFGATLSSFILGISAKIKLQDFILNSNLKLTSYQKSTLTKITSGMQSFKNSNLDFLTTNQVSELKSVLFHSLSNIMIINILLLLIAIKLSLRLKERV